MGGVRKVVGKGWLLAINRAGGDRFGFAAFAVAAAAVFAVFTDAGAVGRAGGAIFAGFPTHADEVAAFIAVGVDGTDAKSVCAGVIQGADVFIIAGSGIEGILTPRP